VINVILDDLVTALDPHYIKVVGNFNVRGGIGITVEAEHIKTPKAKNAVKE
jgi:7-cyano-7-deazaguanine reductase